MAQFLATDLVFINAYLRLTLFWLLARKMLSVMLLLPQALIKPSTVHEGWQGFKRGNVKLESTTK